MNSLTLHWKSNHEFKMRTAWEINHITLSCIASVLTWDWIKSHSGQKSFVFFGKTVWEIKAHHTLINPSVLITRYGNLWKEIHFYRLWENESAYQSNRLCVFFFIFSYIKMLSKVILLATPRGTYSVKLTCRLNVLLEFNYK